MLLTPVGFESNFHLMCSDVLDYILDFELEELCGEASLAQLHVSQSSDGPCHSLSVSGFNDKLFLIFKVCVCECVCVCGVCVCVCACVCMSTTCQSEQ